MKLLPKARNTDLVVQDLTKETLIYDLITDKACNLNETSSIVFNACNGKTTFDELKRRHKFTDDLIYLALDQLKNGNLLKANTNYVSPFAGINRREVIRKVGLATMIALPFIASITAPPPAGAQSCQATNTSCSFNEQCCTGVCYITRFDGLQCCVSSTTMFGYPPGQRAGCFNNTTGCNHVLGSCCSGSARIEPNDNFCPTSFGVPACICT